MSDRREQILVRLQAIAQGLPDAFKSVVRNRGLRSNEQRPAMAILDGDETVRLRYPVRGSRGPEFGPHLMAMTPEVWVIETEDRPRNTDTGLRLNTWRMAFMKAIASDAQLKALLGSNGGIEFNGAETDLKNGDSVQGLMQINITLLYVFNPLTD